MSVAARRARVLCLTLVAALCGAATEAQADWHFTPFIGGTFGGQTALPDLEQGAGSAKTVFGGSAGWLSDGLLGIQADFGYTPRFFERDATAGLLTGSNVLTFGADVIVAAPLSVTRESLRPYLVGGVGLIHAAIEEGQDLFPELFDRARDSVGINMGGGAIGFITPRTGLRFELRYFRSLERDANPFTGDRAALLKFWRATVGVVVRR